MSRVSAGAKRAAAVKARTLFERPSSGMLARSARSSPLPPLLLPSPLVSDLPSPPAAGLAPDLVSMPVNGRADEHRHRRQGNEHTRDG